MGGVKKRKRERRLLARLTAWHDHGEYPRTANPGKMFTNMHQMHKPGGKR